MSPNQIFYNFLKLSYPKLSKSFKKRGDGEIYETFSSLKEIGHKFIYNINKQEITHMYYSPAFRGGEYYKKLATEVVKVCMLENGFRTLKVAS